MKEAFLCQNKSHSVLPIGGLPIHHSMRISPRNQHFQVQSPSKTIIYRTLTHGMMVQDQHFYQDTVSPNGQTASHQATFRQ